VGGGARRRPASEPHGRGAGRAPRGFAPGARGRRALPAARGLPARAVRRGAARRRGLGPGGKRVDCARASAVARTAGTAAGPGLLRSVRRGLAAPPARRAARAVPLPCGAEEAPGGVEPRARRAGAGGVPSTGGERVQMRRFSRRQRAPGHEEGGRLEELLRTMVAMGALAATEALADSPMRRLPAQPPP
jgi:hypothetical protein